MASKFDEAIDKAIDERINALLEKLDMDFVSTANYATKQMKKEIVDVYNSMITQFYKYHTKSYIRHWEGRPGTEEGQNLYSGLKIIDHHSGRFNWFVAKIDASEMTGGYQHHSKSKVLDFVYSGTRFETKKSYLTMTWVGSYKDDYLSVKNVTLKHAFNQFFENYAENFTKVFYSRWRSLGHGNGR